MKFYFDRIWRSAVIVRCVQYNWIGFIVHRFSLCSGWEQKILAMTKQSAKTSRIVPSNSPLYQIITRLDEQFFCFCAWRWLTVMVYVEHKSNPNRVAKLNIFHTLNANKPLNWFYNRDTIALYRIAPLAQWFEYRHLFGLVRKLRKMLWSVLFRRDEGYNNPR